MDITQLQSEYGILGHVDFIEGAGGLPFIAIQNQNATGLISLHGGQILSFKPKSENTDLLFLSKKSLYEDGKAIRGGIPVCWPWFGPDPKGLQRPNHGFVRNHLWSVNKTASTDAETTIVLEFTQSHKQETTWNYPFVLTLEFTLGQNLSLKLTTQNTGDKPFSITQAFHTYFRIGDINKAHVLGLENYRYFDKLDQGKQKIQSGAVTISEEVDRIYEDVDHHVVLNDPMLNRQIEIVSANCKTGVVWNPWQQSSRKMADLGNQDYKHFICVETGNIAFDLIQVSPGSSHSLLTHYKIEKQGSSSGKTGG
ncbi:MAG: D-hexose-6-phosphate mutarotase [Methyloglobulus sp.]|nr:D-hexose-6-phosphate mutarotase [Methyloglobulus sp.]